MARNGVTQEQVHEAAGTLHRSGQPVTVAAVRRALGETGSYTTISNHLRSWRQGDGGQPMPKDLERSVVSLLGRLWRAFTLPGRETDRRVQLLESELHDYEDHVRDLERQQAEFAERFETLQQELERSERALRQMEAELNTLKCEGVGTP